MLCYNQYYAAYAYIQSILQTATITIRTYYYIRNIRDRQCGCSGCKVYLVLVDFAGL